MSFNRTVRNLKPPVLNQYGGTVASGFQVQASNPNAYGVLYYSVNGSDPRPEGGGRPTAGTASLGGLNAVLTTVYLIFSTGYSAGPQEPRDLCAEAIFLAQLITDLCPDQAEVEGALALMLLTDARRTARTGPDGCTLPLADQDRRLWDAAKASRGRALLDAAMARRQPGPFQIKAAIAACDMADGGPDWPQIALLYAGLYAHEPTPVVLLNHAVAVAEAGDLPRALALLDPLDTALSDYQPFHAARAELLFRAGHSADSRRAYDRAIATAPSASDAAFLTKRRARLGE
jgi:RNA polymerase sigma-70 factor (ECF subfamily)